MEYASSPVAHPGTHTRSGESGVAVAAALNELRNDDPFQHLKGARLTEERGHADREVLAERVDFVGMRAQELDVALDVIDVAEAPCAA